MSECERMALDLLREVEGLRLEAYRDSAGVLTIGYGHTRGVRPGDTCTKEQAEEWLRGDCRSAVDIVRIGSPSVMAEHQRAALVVFAFNVGSGRRQGACGPDDRGRDGYLINRYGGKSGVRIAVDQAAHDEVVAQLRRWVYAGGVVSQGLRNRREKEVALYLGRSIPKS